MVCCDKHCWGLHRFKDAFDVKLVHIGFMHTYINLLLCMDLLLHLVSYCPVCLVKHLRLYLIIFNKRCIFVHSVFIS